LDAQKLHNTDMKVISILFLTLLCAGCVSPSRFANDPRAAVVGPAYLDAIADYPRDKDTQYYYPAFAVSDLTNSADVLSPAAPPAPGVKIDELLVQIPEPTAEGSKSTGKGWACLERVGIPFSAAPK
jgi:hypothetical protein